MMSSSSRSSWDRSKTLLISFLSIDVIFFG
jgi:hypothetical protein